MGSTVKDRQIHIGIMGGGMMAQVGHIPFYLNDPRVVLHGVCDERPSLQKALGVQLGKDRVYSTRNELLSNNDIEAIVLSSPRPATGPLSLEILSSDKHLLAEKPMAHTVEQAQKLVDAANSLNLTYMIGYMKLYDPGVRAAKEYLNSVTQSGSLGRLLSARFFSFAKSYAAPVPPHTRPKESRAERYPVWPTHPDWLDEQFHEIYAWYLNAISHNVNLAQHFISNLEVMKTLVHDEGAVTTLFEADGVPVTLDVGKTSAGRWVEGAEFNFESGRVELTIPSPMAVDQVASVSIYSSELEGGTKELETNTGWCFEMQARAYIDVLCGDVDALLSPATMGLDDIKLIENIWKNVKG